MLLHTEHKRRLALTSRTAKASASASSSLDRRMWNASRCALFAPTPGSFFNSSINRDIGSANLDIEGIIYREPRVQECPNRQAFRPGSTAFGRQLCVQLR